MIQLLLIFFLIELPKFVKKITICEKIFILKIRNFRLLIKKEQFIAKIV